ncbi:ABC transporter substrate-binding protein [Candidatus Marithrix sp. Canyon 246]|uniref:ABC transporter substrate-binding protein n=1 Tax=Candidatus Marithrix sp. Canyon 246 TaxID=1827136 RepID=UPI00084A04F1|nr:ABC transporter substrate-binding protein [Candidatus Marithrix sp. Canyon 246]
MYKNTIIPLLSLLLLTSCDTWNNPYPSSLNGKNILFTSFSERPKHLDPVRSYSSNEYTFIAQIYEPPLQYDYLKRPYTLTPLSATEVPKPQYFDKNGNQLADDVAVDQIDHSVYEIKIKKGIQYQPHPCFVAEYQTLSESQLSNIHQLSDFEKTASRELVASDFVYQIKRLAHPKLHSPIYGLMSEYIVGLKDLRQKLKKDQNIDLTQHSLSGIEIVDKYTYKIKIKGKYQQFIYWLAMPFFAAMPPEAVKFYAQQGLIKRNISLDWYPVGTGAYMLTVNNPNYQMVLEKNPNFHGETYPSEAGEDLPFIDKAIYSLEKESIPYWNKFLQGYYDASGISSENFDQVVSIDNGNATLSDDMKQKGIQLVTSVRASTYYLGFNMLDPVLGNKGGESARKLRQAISIAINVEEYISIFLNDRGIAAQSPLPPGIYGYRDGKDGINPYVYDWKNAKPERKSIEIARRLVADAGYPNGIDAKTGKPLVLYFDSMSGGADDKSRLNWYRKQFKKLKIQLIVRATDYNRFQDKMKTGSAQIFGWGWNADYPDPENFLFLLYGSNGKTKFGGENAANYQNPRFDALFEQMINMDNGEARQKIIDDMIEILRYDAPWVWNYHPMDYSLLHEYLTNFKPNVMANNTLKYKRIDPEKREQYRQQHNTPIVLPLWLLLIFMVIIVIPAVLSYRKSERKVVS